eukprot:TRINITY_DN1325_c0_g1_i1.p1 TRINITY_DN1325_c0_g1~~TRINITY_DN1325_c0_g1_i1.p1  ORF type:complete len:173 (-),score=0.34 TRINITY_DN1325_c0_g1_i1:81-599(-)
MSRFLIELLSLAEPPKRKDALAPLYIYTLVKNSKVDVGTCQQFALRCKSRLIASNPSRLVIKKLQGCSYEYLVNHFFMLLVKIIEENVSSRSIITADYLIDVIEHVISKTIPYISPPATFVSPNTNTIFLSICQLGLVVDMTLGVRRALRETIVPCNIAKLPQAFRSPKYAI